ncbi:M48 family metallopeptidase [Candidatus Nitrospira bockiana]
MEPKVDGLVLELPEAPATVIPYDHIAVAAGGFDEDHLVLVWRAGESDRRVYLKDAAVLRSLESSAPAALAAQLRRATRRIAERPRSLRRRVGIGAFVLLLAAGGLWWSSDALLRAAVAHIPHDWERQLGEAAKQEILTGQRLLTEGPAVEAVQTITERLVGQAPANPYRFTVIVVRSDVVNAVALPGGTIVVYTGLLKQAGTPEEVAGVLAHEVSHVLLRHGLEGLVQSLGLVAALMVVTGNREGFVGAVERLGIELATLKFSREKETEADLEGLQLLHRAALPTDGMVTFFERLASAEGPRVAWLSTHPLSRDRADRLKRAAAALAPQEPVPLPFEWSAVKGSLSP